MNPANQIYFFILIEEPTCRVLEVAYSETPHLITQANRRVLISEPARWLYAALSGRFIETQPTGAHHIIANHARAHLLKNQNTNPAWALACQVVTQWGNHFRPWLAMYKVENGKIVDAPEYYQMYNLAGRELANTEHFYCEFTQGLAVDCDSYDSSRDAAPYQTCIIEGDLPQLLQKRTIYLVCEDGFLWHVSMICPCGCNEILHMNLIPDERPCWQITKHRDQTVSLYPSVWRQKGCKSHFWFQRGYVIWCNERAGNRRQ